MLVGFRLFEGDTAKRHKHVSTGILHGLGRIGTQIHQYLLNLGGVAHNVCRFAADVGSDFNGRRQGGSQKLEGFIDERFDIDRLKFLFGLAAERQNLPDQIPGAISGPKLG